MMEKKSRSYPGILISSARLIAASISLGLILIAMAACSPAAMPSPAEIVKTVPVTQEVKEVEKEVVVTVSPAAAAEATQPPVQEPTQPLPTEGAAPTKTPTLAATSTRESRPTAAEATSVATLPAASPTPVLEARRVELEWPSRLRFGESDVVRLSLIPSKDGYTATADFPEHQLQTQDVPVQRPSGYELSAVARLDGVTFDIAPSGDQERLLPEGERLDWRWTLTPQRTGQQRLSIILLLRWTPLPGAQGSRRESTAYSKALEVRVTSFLGLTRGQALAGGLLGLIFGGGLSLGVLLVRPPQPGLRRPPPNPRLAVEPRPEIKLSRSELYLLQALFGRYDRLALEGEFLSGYSGARTFLALPIRPDGRADAYTIVKMGERSSIQREFENYEAFVKDTLPPVTARIQHAPVTLPPSPARSLGRGDGRKGMDLAALQYTFIAEPGKTPTSLRQSLNAIPDPARLLKLFETFGPNWWMQRRPYTFRLIQEYDVMLPTHLVVEPCAGRGKILDGRTPPPAVNLEVGQMVALRHFPQVERRVDGRSLSLRGSSIPGQPALRVRWLGLENPNGATGRVVATRWTVLRAWTAEFDRFGLPDPLERLPVALNQTLSGTQSVIHGDLNLENVLVGPGDFVWLIDFAQTREGHTLFDFAHLYAEIVAHVLADQIPSAADYVSLLREPAGSRFMSLYALLTTLDEIALRCLFNPAQPHEWGLARFAACLGALKFANLSPYARHLLYLTAARLSQKL